MTKCQKSTIGLLGALTMIAYLVCASEAAVTCAQDKFPTGSFVGGEFTLTFDSDGNSSVSVNDKVVVKGTYVVTGDQIVITDKEGEMSCTGTEVGKYKWKYDGKALRFSKLEDECEGRVGGLTSQPFVKKEKDK